jgi:hypothetical protein
MCKQTLRNKMLHVRISLSLSLSFPLPPLWSIGHSWNALFHFSFLILRESVGLLGWGTSQSQGRYLYKQTNIDALSGIRIHGPSVWTGEDNSCLRPRGHCNRRMSHWHVNNGSVWKIGFINFSNDDVRIHIINWQWRNRIPLRRWSIQLHTLLISPLEGELQF